MITAVLEHRGNTLAVELPCRLYELQEDLSSIGITWQVSSLPVSGTGNIHVELTADDPVGEMVLSQMECVELIEVIPNKMPKTGKNLIIEEHGNQKAKKGQ